MNWQRQKMSLQEKMQYFANLKIDLFYFLHLQLVNLKCLGDTRMSRSEIILLNCLDHCYQPVVYSVNSLPFWSRTAPEIATA